MCSERQCATCKRDCEYAAVECSLCKDLRHLECVKIPLKFLFAGGSQAGIDPSANFEFWQSLGYKLLEAKCEGSGKTPKQIFDETLEKHGVRYDSIRDIVILDHVCKVCVMSREVDKFLNFYDPETKMTLLDL